MLAMIRKINRAELESCFDSDNMKVATRDIVFFSGVTGSDYFGYYLIKYYHESIISEELKNEFSSVLFGDKLNDFNYGIGNIRNFLGIVVDGDNSQAILDRYKGCVKSNSDLIEKFHKDLFGSSIEFDLDFYIYRLLFC